MHCLISGCNFLLKHVPNESFQYHKDANDQPEFIFNNGSGDIFPYLLVNIGSGVSIVKVEGPDKYERIGGTSTGGGTFWGLGSLLTDAKGFDELLAMTTVGRTKNVDMLVGDIYGGYYKELNLPADLTASSFGKAARASRDSSTGSFRQPDIAKALLQMISNDIGQISSLYAQLHGLKRIFFGGYFIRGHPVTMHTISFAINFFSKGKQQALFLRHEGYLGAVGAFISSRATPMSSNNTSWKENFAGSSGFQQQTSLASSSFEGKTAQSASYDVFQLDQIQFQYETCPLLADPSNYNPDFMDLSIDETAREYWLSTFETGLNHFVEQAVNSQSGQSDAEERGEIFRQNFLDRMKILRVTPYAFGRLTVRSLLDTRDQFLAAHTFCDPYLQVKQQENELAVSLLQKRLVYIDTLDYDERQLELIESLVAGNIFDWGARASQKCFNEPNFGFDEAKQKLQKRPWLKDDVDLWLERLKSSSSHSLVVVFVDNSGADIILGVFPFVRELLRRGSKVVLAANTYPSINDVIYSELAIVCERVAEMCPIVRTAMSEEMLVVMETGSSSPCLDLRHIHTKLATVMKDADLIILEGMGRQTKETRFFNLCGKVHSKLYSSYIRLVSSVHDDSYPVGKYLFKVSKITLEQRSLNRCIHTNYLAEFTCESIRCAVIKNEWLAKKLGGDIFSVVFKYDQPTKKK